MPDWPATTAFLDAAVGTRVYPRARRLVNAAVRGALLVDLGLAGSVFTNGDRVHARATDVGFAPANSLLHTVATDTGVALDELVCRAAVTAQDVLNEFVANGWWDRLSPQPWRFRQRYRPALVVVPRSGPAAQFAALLMSLFDGETDPDDLRADSAELELGTATDLAGQVIRELGDLRSWLTAAVTTGQSAGG